MKILIFGITGMLGHTLFRSLQKNSAHTVIGTQRQPILSTENNKISFDALTASKNETLKLVQTIKPDVIINCIGLIKQLDDAKYNKAKSIRINALWPHTLGEIGETENIKVIHFSTDCVFSGEKGNYDESEAPNATDLYGMTKLLGEIAYKNSLTLRTSIIGHEVSTANSLVEWFLKQKDACKGYSKAIYTGFPTITISRILQDYIFPNPNLSGIYHLASKPITKFELLKLIAKQYEKNILITADESVKIDRSLNAAKFNTATKFTPPSWTELVSEMHSDYIHNEHKTGKAL